MFESRENQYLVLLLLGSLKGHLSSSSETYFRQRHIEMSYFVALWTTSCGSFSRPQKTIVNSFLRFFFGYLLTTNKNTKTFLLFVARTDNKEHKGKLSKMFRCLASWQGLFLVWQWHSLERSLFLVLQGQPLRFSVVLRPLLRFISDGEVRSPFLGLKIAIWDFFRLDIFWWTFFDRKILAGTFLGLIKSVS